MQHTGFVHLHCHSQYSLLDGANRIQPLVEKVRQLRMPALAVTDHGNMYGAIEFYLQAAEHGIKPIIGCEIYVAPGSRFDKKGGVDNGTREYNYHLTLLAMDLKGYKNLCRLVTAGFLEGFYYRPRVDKQLLKELNEGLIALSGCLRGEVNVHLAAGHHERAREEIENYSRIFPGRFYLEIQDNKLPAQEKANALLAELAQDLSLPLVATNDCHYIDRDDAPSHDVLLCIQTGKSVEDQDRLKLGTNELYVKSAEEMCGAFAYCPEAVANTLEIAKRCNVELEFGRHHFPHFEPPRGRTLDDTFEQEAREGLRDRLSDWTEEQRRQRWIAYEERLNSEIRIIQEMQFSGYFLIVADFINYAKRNGIPVGPGRGSAAGSLVAYALRITDLDPIRHGLLFERFLNPERKSLPDIDVDFCIRGRDRVIQYVKEKYGADKVAQITTFGTLKAKAAIKDVGRTLGFSFAETDAIAKLVPAPKQGFDYSLSDAIKMEPRLSEFAKDGRVQSLLTHALKLEGLTRHSSTHAAGVVLSNLPLVDHLPLYLDKDGGIVTQYDMESVEKIGLVKFDFLGLKTLTSISDTIKLIEKNEGPRINPISLPLDDPGTYELLSQGDTTGVFQLESSGIREMTVRIKPGCFEDLVAILALYRPGPLDSGMAEQYIKRKAGKEPIRMLHPLLKPILQETYGVIVYQEQVMQIAQQLARYSLGEADILRRAMGKKDPDEMASQRERFIAGAAKNRIPVKKAEEIFDQMETFARYGFNKSHSAAYALISYQTAYLKAHYPVEFMAALMTSEMDDTDKVIKNLAECRRMGIKVLPPDINESSADFTPVGSAIRFGLAAVRNVGMKAVDAIQQSREKEGKFTGIHDFCRRIDSTLINKRVIESLIKCGAFDSTHAHRSQMMASLDDALRAGQAHLKRAASNQLSIFASLDEEAPHGGSPFIPDIPEWPQNQLLAFEKEALGFYITGHPLDKHEKDLARFVKEDTHSLKTSQENRHVEVCGVVTGLKLRNTKRGERYAHFQLEDRAGFVEVIAWPDVYKKCHENLVRDDPIWIRGKLEVGEERVQLIATEIASLEDLIRKSERSITLTFDAARVPKQKLLEIREALSHHRGGSRVTLSIVGQQSEEVLIDLPDNLRIAATGALEKEIQDILGYPAVTLY